MATAPAFAFALCKGVQAVTTNNGKKIVHFV
jgi:hypothetical protein